MKKLHRILLLIVSIIGLGLSAMLTALLFVESFFLNAVRVIRSVFPWLEAQTIELWMGGIIAGYIVFICLCFLLLLLLALFCPGKSNDLVLAKSKGSLRFSKQAVESAVRYSFADVSGVRLSRVRTKLDANPEKIKIYVRLSVDSPDGLLALTETVQSRIESALASSLGITVKSINIKVADSGPEKPTVKTENVESADNNSRVL